MTTTRPAPPVLAGRPAQDPVDVAVDACTRFAAHLVLLSHQFGEYGLDDDERERLAAALTVVEGAMNVATTPPQPPAVGAADQ
jgi:hypothetical protein